MGLVHGQTSPGLIAKAPSLYLLTYLSCDRQNDRESSQSSDPLAKPVFLGSNVGLNQAKKEREQSQQEECSCRYTFRIWRNVEITES